MKRKKFVKQLMAIGYSRNKANTVAMLVQLTNDSYRARSSSYRSSLAAVEIISGLNAGLRRTSKAACLFGDAMSNLTKELRRFENVCCKIP